MADLSSVFREHVEKWLSAKGNSLRKLSRKSGISYSQLRKIMRNGPDAPKPTENTFYRMLIVIMPMQLAQAAFKEATDTDYTAIERLTSRGSKAKDPLLNDTQEAYFYATLVAKGRADLKHAEQLLGNRLNKILRKYEKNGICQIVGNEVTFAPKYAEIASTSSLKKIAQLTLDLCDGLQPHNFEETRIEGLNELGLLKVKELVLHFKNELMKILSDSAHTGEHTFLITLNSTVL